MRALDTSKTQPRSSFGATRSLFVKASRRSSSTSISEAGVAENSAFFQRAKGNLSHSQFKPQRVEPNLNGLQGTCGLDPVFLPPPPPGRAAELASEDSEADLAAHKPAWTRTCSDVP